MRKVFVVMLVCFMFFAIEPGFADLTFGYHIQQIGNIAMLMPEGGTLLGDKQYGYSDLGMSVAFGSEESDLTSIYNLYYTILNKSDAFNFDGETLDSIELYDVDGNKNEVVLLHYSTSNYDTIKYFVLCFAFNDGVLSRIMFANPTFEDIYSTYDDFLYVVHDFLNTIVFLET